MNEAVSCPIEGCTATVCGGVMCLEHWKLVPFTVQFMVYRELVNTRSARSDSARIEATRKYIEARNRSIQLAQNATG